MHKEKADNCFSFCSEGTTVHQALEEVEENPENILENQQNLTIRQRMVLAAKRRMQRR